MALASQPSRTQVEAALARATSELLAARTSAGHWVGELSSSALSTATAVTALAMVDRASRATHHASPIRTGLGWLANHANADGGWGDTEKSLSNLSTTALCWAAFGAVSGADQAFARVVAAAEGWLTQHAGSTEPSVLAPAIIKRYGKDRTFSVPILTMCALAGRLGAGREAWRWVLPLPFELAACPQEWFAWLRLPVVSYALPALIAIGQARHHHRPTRNLFARLLRTLTRKRTLRVLKNIQPSSGGFLEATPLTSFVVMSLASSGNVEHAVTAKGLEFLLRSQRPDGSWPIDTNLATWVTTLSVNTLWDREFSNRTQERVEANRLESENRKVKIRDWLLAQQYRQTHSYTNAAPGGWAWTDLPGGVPDADDTAGALLALRILGEPDERTCEAASLGIQWLLDLQNRDGGIPTFCRGWGTLPFDRSAPDLTAHAIRAWLAWIDDLPAHVRQQTHRALEEALSFLVQDQQADGSWVPLWFGNQFAPAKENRTYGTARVLRALVEIAKQTPSVSTNSIKAANEMLRKATAWLLSAQHQDGSWGESRGQSSVEETALAVEALAGVLASAGGEEPTIAWPITLTFDEIRSAVVSGSTWLICRVESGEWKEPSPIGFYFAKLWYYERLYPLIFTVGALAKVTMTTVV